MTLRAYATQYGWTTKTWLTYWWLRSVEALHMRFAGVLFRLMPRRTVYWVGVFTMGLVTGRPAMKYREVPSIPLQDLLRELERYSHGIEEPK